MRQLYASQQERKQSEKPSNFFSLKIVGRKIGVAHSQNLIKGCFVIWAKQLGD